VGKGTLKKRRGSRRTWKSAGGEGGNYKLPSSELKIRLTEKEKKTQNNAGE